MAEPTPPRLADFTGRDGDYLRAVDEYRTAIREEDASMNIIDPDGWTSDERRRTRQRIRLQVLRNRGYLASSDPRS
jgi:hypothetical protein